MFCAADSSKGTEEAWVPRGCEEPVQASSWGQAHCEVHDQKKTVVLSDVSNFGDCQKINHSNMVTFWILWNTDTGICQNQYTKHWGSSELWTIQREEKKPEGKLTVLQEQWSQNLCAKEGLSKNWSEFYSFFVCSYQGWWYVGWLYWYSEGKIRNVNIFTVM